MAYLSIRLDQIAQLRQGSRTNKPNPARAAVLSELAGADGLTACLRTDQQYLTERDLYVLKEISQTRINVEISPTPENMAIVNKLKPHQVTFVPEIKRDQDAPSGFTEVEDFSLWQDDIASLQERGIKVFISVVPAGGGKAIKAISKLKLDGVHLFTGMYASAETEAEGLAEIEKLKEVSKVAEKMGLVISAGGRLDYINIQPLARLEIIDEFIIGQAIFARSVMVGIDKAVSGMIRLVGKS